MESAQADAQIPLPELLRVIVRSQLLAPDHLQQLLTRLEGAPDSSAIWNALKDAVQQGWLTNWQMNELLAGRSKFQIDKYRLLEPIGKGGMGIVYRAEHTGMGRIVAVKVMSRKLLSDERLVQRFVREIHAVAALNHPNIVKAYDADIADGRYYLVMEYVPGKDLADLLKQRGRLSIPVACECIMQAASGLQHAHENGLVHRDIKPANLLVTTVDEFPQVKLLDLGLARFVQSVEDGGATRSGVILGTVDYMAPEQALDTRSVDVRADIYSLGCTLYHALTGQKPFAGKKSLERLMARTREDVPLLRTLLPHAPVELEAVLAKMVARNRDERYATPAEVADALAPFAGRDVQPFSLVESSPSLVSDTMATDALAIHTHVPGGRSAPQYLEDIETIVVGSTAHGTSPSELRDASGTSVSASGARSALTKTKAGERRRSLISAGIGLAVALLAAGIGWWALRDDSKQPVQRQSLAVNIAQGRTEKHGERKEKTTVDQPAGALNVPPEGYTSLFDGRTLDQWTNLGNSIRWSIFQGALYNQGSRGWLISKKTYKNFELKLEWRGIGPSNSGVAVRLTSEQLSESGSGDPPPGDLQIDISTDKSGTLWSKIPPQPDPDQYRNNNPSYRYSIPNVDRTSYRPFLAWNEFEIRCIGTRVRVLLNGVEVNRGDYPDLPAEGRIGFQALEGRTEFRNIFLREIAPGETLE